MCNCLLSVQRERRCRFTARMLFTAKHQSLFWSTKIFPLTIYIVMASPGPHDCQKSRMQSCSVEINSTSFAASNVWNEPTSSTRADNMCVCFPHSGLQVIVQFAQAMERLNFVLLQNFLILKVATSFPAKQDSGDRFYVCRPNSSFLLL